MPVGFIPPAPLTPEHDRTRFSCGKSSLDHWLRRYALANQGLDSSKTFVICPADDPRRVVGYYSLSVGSVVHEKAPPSVEEGMPPYDIPVIVLARLAVDERFRRPALDVRLGEALLCDALVRAVGVAEDVGIRAMLVDALDEEARGFYVRYGFEPSPVSGPQLFLPMARIRASIEAAGS